MKRAAVPSILVAVVLLAVAVIAEAQQPKKVPRIGYLTVSFPVDLPVEAFRQGLRELGTWKEKTSSLSGDLRRGKIVGSPSLRRSSCGSR